MNRAVVREAVEASGMEVLGVNLAGIVTVREGFDQAGEHIVYLLNDSSDAVSCSSPVTGEVIVGGVDIDSSGLAREDSAVCPLSGANLRAGDELTIGPWNLVIVVEHADRSNG